MIRKLTLKQWEALIAESKRNRAELLGWSPGGVAHDLGITRQAVHKAIHRGDLDCVIVNDERTGKLVMFMIPESSVEHFKLKRQAQASLKRRA